MTRRLLLALAIALALAACGEEAEKAEVPPPREPTREAIGRYCGMVIVDHPGPKGQVVLAGEAEPIWFSSVRDTLAFTMLPEEPKAIAAIYVNDMGRAASWSAPGPGSWVAAREALYVVGSTARGGMGVPEVVPFSDRAAAERFAREQGGRIHTFDEVPEDAILGPADAEQRPHDAAPSHRH